MAIGVLALQGDFAAHSKSLARLGVKAVEVRRAEQLSRIAGLVLPGGESTALLNLMADEPWFDELRAFRSRGGAILATCAGAVLVARKVVGPPQPSLDLIDLVVRRNAYGRQIDSFEVDLRAVNRATPLPAVFIRAPVIEAVGPSVEVLASLPGSRADDRPSGWDPRPVLVRQGPVIAATFHPELTGDDWLHQWFLELARTRAPGRAGAGRTM